MEMLIGAFGRMFSNNTGQGMVMQTTALRAFFQKLVIQRPDFLANMLGMYSFLSVGRTGEAIVAGMQLPDSLLQSRKNCASWNPKGDFGMDLDRIKLEPIEFNGELCPDSLWGNCIEYLLGTGNEVRDILATTEGRQFFNMFMNRLMAGLKNSEFDLFHFGQHELIKDAEENGTWNKKTQTKKQWADFVDQQLGIDISGIYTLQEQGAADGHENYNVSIAAGDITNGEFTGSAIDLFDKMLDAKKYTFDVALNDGMVRGIFDVTPSIARRYKRELIDNYGGNIPDAYRYLITNQSEANPTGRRDLFMYDGHIVYSNGALGNFYNRVGATDKQSASFIMPGVYGIAHDVDSLRMGAGTPANTGLKVYQSPDPKDKGRITMAMDVKAQAAIVEKDFVVYATNE